jgi:hypothetical protein
MSSSSLPDPMRPSRCFVVERAGLKATMQDADQAGGEPAQRGVVADLTGAQPVVLGPGTRRGRVGCLGRQLQGLGGVAVLEGDQRRGQVLAQGMPQPLDVPGALGRSASYGRG